jgi:putative ABC transport system ATP-binding protein
MIIAKSIVKNVPVHSGQLTILQGIDLHIKRSESVAIVGSSGSGKSTLLALLAGLDNPSQGEIYLDSRALHTLSEDERALLRADKVGFVFQSFQLLQGLTAIENIALPLELKKVPDAKAQAMAYLAKVGLAERGDHYPNQLSGGEQQRVAIARAFASQPSVLFADEPTGNLDTETGERIVNLLFELNRDEGCTLVLVTHDVQLAKRCDRRLCMSAGRLSEAFDD